MKQRIAMAGSALALAGGLTLGSMSPAMAGESAECRGLFATVENITVDEWGVGTMSLVNVKGSEGVETLTLVADNGTLYHMPTFAPWQCWGDLSADLAASGDPDRTQPVVAGDRIAVSLDEPFVAGEEAVASKVMTVIPGRHMHRHQLGVVARVEGDSVTIVDREGEQIEMTLRSGLDVEPGQFVVMVANREGNEVQLRAMEAHRAGDMIERFKGYMYQALGQDDLDRASGLLEQAHERHMNLLQGMQSKLQDRNQERLAAAVGQAIDNEQSCYQEAVQLRDRIQEQARTSGRDGREGSQTGKS